MPEHVHLLLHPRSEIYSIADILRDIKGPFSRALSEHLKQKNPIRLRSLKVVIGEREYYRVWQAGGGFDRNLHSPVLLRRAVDYIEWNPVRRRLVKDPCQWEWSSARWRAGISDVPIAIDPPGWTE
jgi:REP element-mobilizing transposase RayT